MERKILFIGSNNEFEYFHKIFFSNNSIIAQLYDPKNKKNYSLDKFLDSRFDAILISDCFLLDKSLIKELHAINKSLIPIYPLKKWVAYNFESLPSILLDDFNINRVKINLKMKKIQFKIKRIFDFLFASLLLIITSPIIIISSFLIYLEDQGSIFYKQERIGHLNKPFIITKLRTMHTDAEKDGARWASNNDLRITVVGNFLRKTRIDELPQLISVMKGDMSLIGPRPERQQFIEILRREIPYYDTRSLIKPGLSGWAQVNYSYGASTTHAINKLGYELFYLENFSLFLDLIIFFKTIKLVFNLRGSNPIGFINSNF